MIALVKATKPAYAGVGVIVPAPHRTMASWFRTEFRTDYGKAFNEMEVPWVTAPHGPCDAIDNPQYNILWLQWAARMFKTTFAQGVMMRFADEDPCGMMYAAPDELLCKQIFGRFWKMLEQSPRLRDQVPHENRQAKTHIKLHWCEIYGTWARGKSRLADKSIRIGHAGEIDKWEMQSTDTEGDPLVRFIKRGAEYADAKFILESTPSQKGHSRVERGRLRSTNHQFQVPCPHCAKFQRLIFGDGKLPRGIFWEKSAAGKNDPEIARKTAYYVCQHCQGQISDLHRPTMMNAGIWVPEGVTVDHDRAMRAREYPQFDTSYFRGEPRRNGKEYSSQISVFYALFSGWGQIAYDFLIKKSKRTELRQWWNEDAAMTWSEASTRKTWEELYDKWVTEDDRLIVPEGFSLLTAAFDKQFDGTFPYVVEAWNHLRQCRTIDYGYAHDEAEIESILTGEYKHEDGGPPLMIERALIDSGFRPKGVVTFCKRMQAAKVRVWPCKGSSRPLGLPWKLTKVKADQRKRKQRKAPPSEEKMQGEYSLVLVDSITTQDWIEDQISTLHMNDPEGYGIFMDAPEVHQDFLEQLLNDVAEDKPDSSGIPKRNWVKMHPETPNDYRDVRRYSYVAMMFATRNQPPKTRKQLVDGRVAAPRPKTREAKPFIRRPSSTFFGRRK